MAGSYDQFFHDPAVRESIGVFDQNASPNYQALGDNGLSDLGAYQFEDSAMIDLGCGKDDGNPNANQWKAGYWTGKDGINSEHDSLNDPAVQDGAAHQWMQNFVWGWVRTAGLDHSIGQTIDGISITASGLLAGAHLRGADAVQQFLESAGRNDSADPYGSPQFVVSVDGKQQGGTQTATASHADGKAQDLTQSGAFGTGVHDVAVVFLDDAWGGTPDTDRNLYASSIDDNGKLYASATAALMTNGTVHFQVGAANGT